MSRTGRFVRRFVIGLAIALGVLVVLAVGFFLFLLTPPGERMLQRVALDRINETIMGEADLRDLEFTGGTLELQGVVLRTPEGEEVAYAERIFIDLAFAPLLSREVHLDRLELSDFAVRLRRQDDGRWNLAAALERVEPPIEEPELVPLVVDEFVIERGTIDVQAEAAGQMRHLRIEDIGATGFVALRDQVSGAVDLRAHTTQPAEAPLTVTARALVESATQHVELRAWLGEAIVEGQLQLPTSGDEIDLDLGEIDGWLRVDAPAFSVADFTYGPVRLAAQMSNGRLTVPTAHAELPGTTLTSAAPEGDTAARLMLSVDALEITAEALGALLALELPDVSGEGEIELHVENPIDAANVDVVARMRQLGVDDLELGDVRLEASVQQRDVSLAASVAEPHRAAMRVEGEYTDARRETLRLDHIALAYPQTRWTNPAPALIHTTDAGIEVEGLSLVSDAQRIDADVQWTDARRVARVQLSGLQLASIPTALHPPELSFGGVLDGHLELRRPADEPEASIDMRLTRGRLEGVSGVSARLSALYTDERVRGQLAATLLSGTANANFDLPASFPPADGAALEARLDVNAIALEQAWQAAGDLVPDSLAEQVEHASGRLGLHAALDGAWPDPILRGRLTVEDGSVTLTEAGRIRDIELLLEGDQDRFFLRSLDASSEAGSLTATGEANRVGENLHYRYQLNVSAEQFPVPLDEPVTATFDATITGEVTPDQVTSEVQAEDVRIMQPEPPPPSPPDDEEE